MLILSCRTNLPKALANQMLMGLDVVILEKLVQVIHNGYCLKGFMANSGVGEVIHAEAWGLFYGFKMAAECNVQKLACGSLLS